MIKIAILFLFIFQMMTNPIFAEENQKPNQERYALYKKTEAITQIPWYYLAAIDQYERVIHQDDRIISISFPDSEWFGVTNINKDHSEIAINLHNGIGKDGN